MEAELLLHDKQVLPGGNVVEIKIWKVPKSKDKPHGYKYSLVYIEKSQRIIGYDNAEGKGDHMHYREEERPYKFKSIRSLIEDFYKAVIEEVSK
ncbi:MAG: DUF6516 family protein [Nitrospirota bacterium]